MTTIEQEIQTLTTPRARVLADSVGPLGSRLTTLEITFHRFVLAEFNTHRKFSRNSASSRAIPVRKQIDKVFKDPAFPISWPAEQAGMSGGDELTGLDLKIAKDFYESVWESTLATIIGYYDSLKELYGEEYAQYSPHALHKSVVSRLMEPFMWQTVIVSSTEWDNFFTQRISELAQPEICAVAIEMKKALDRSTPKLVKYGKWHLPLIQKSERKEFDEDVLCTISASRCAKVSYLTHDGQTDVDKDLARYVKLTTANPPHWSPLEHPATPIPGWSDDEARSNFDGWLQLRQVEERER